MPVFVVVGYNVEHAIMLGWPAHRVVLNADEAVREAIATVFRRFGKLDSARQVVIGLREDEVQTAPAQQPLLGKRRLPSRQFRGGEGRESVLSVWSAGGEGLAEPLNVARKCRSRLGYAMGKIWR
jgi:hypothetical protein